MSGEADFRRWTQPPAWEGYEVPSKEDFQKWNPRLSEAEMDEYLADRASLKAAWAECPFSSKTHPFERYSWGVQRGLLRKSAFAFRPLEPHSHDVTFDWSVMPEMDERQFADAMAAVEP